MGDNARYIRSLAMHALGRMGKDLDKDRKEAVDGDPQGDGGPQRRGERLGDRDAGGAGAEGLGGEADEVVKKLDDVLLREGRKSIREAAQAARDKIKAKK